MAIIYSYPLNDNIRSLDELVGTTEKSINGQLKTVTRNFLLQDLAEFFSTNGLQKEITLTTNNTSGPATLNETTGVLNIPNYTGGSDANFVFTQVTPDTTWYITHNLNKFPSVSVVNINNILMYGDIQYVDINNLAITFSAGFSGKAYLN